MCANRYICISSRVYIHELTGIYLSTDRYIPVRDYLLYFSYFNVLSVSRRSAPGRNWILFPLIKELLNFSAVSAPSMVSVTWKLPKSPNFTIFPSAKCFCIIFVNSFSTANTSVSETVVELPAISFEMLFRVTSPSAFALA